MRSHGVSVALGTDGCSSNNNLDMVEEAKMASLLAKVTAMDPTVFPARDALDAATVNGARMYGLNAGRISTGMLPTASWWTSTICAWCPATISSRT
jgi:5-methylthioadenosine/S-adenosylhomocysteine deaminase